MMEVEDRKILMRDRYIICGDLRGFFPPPSMDPLALSSGFVPLTIVYEFFLLMVFMLMSFEFHFNF